MYDDGLSVKQSVFIVTRIQFNGDIDGHRDGDGNSPIHEAAGLPATVQNGPQSPFSHPLPMDVFPFTGIITGKSQERVCQWLRE